MSEATNQGATPKTVPHWAFATAYLGMMLLWGVRQVYYWEPSILDLIIPFGACLTAAWWAALDSIARGHPIPLLARPVFFFLAGILVPIYIIWSRRWFGVMLVGAILVASYAICIITMLVGRMVAFRVPFGQ